MECNKDEALRAKSIAEDKLVKKDFLGAKKFASKAQALYPSLDGISQMLTTLEVCISAEKKINGAVDWYGVLGVGPTADDETIKKQYRKLALVLHPDKNNSTGANDAFKLISEAWTLLSDKAKRSAYHQITGLKGFEPEGPTGTGGLDHTGGPSPSTYTDGAQNDGPPGPPNGSPFSKCGKRKPPAPKSQNKKSAKASGPSKPSSPPSDQRTDTFWTACNHCRVQYEYQNLYRNMTLLCPDCKKAFSALEIPRPISKSGPQKLNPGPAQTLKSNDKNLRTPPSDKNLHTPPSANSSSTPPSANGRGKNVASNAKKSGTGPLRASPSANGREKNVASSAKKGGTGPLRASPSANGRGKNVASNAQESGTEPLRTPPSTNGRGKNVASNAQESGTEPLRTPPSTNGRGKTVASKKSGKDPLHTPPSANDRGNNVASDAQKLEVGQAGEKNLMHAGPHSAPAKVNRAGIAAKIASFGDQLKRTACASSKNGSVGMNGFSKKRKLDKGHKNNKIPEKNVNSGTLSTVQEAVVMRKLMLENARREVTRKLNEPGFEGPVVNPKVNCTIEARERINGNGLKKCRKDAGSGSSAYNTNKQRDETKERDGKINKTGEKCPQKRNNSSADNKNEPFSGTVMNVPDPDFYDFDQDRSENSFSDNEVWAAYDDDDGMPRFYAMIHNAISKRPFKLKISWLNSKTTVEFGSLDWVGSGFYKTCGEFWVGKHEICKFVNAFSGKVKWSKGPRGSVVILPRKGDVWALYRNWSSDWDSSTPDDDVIHKYDMVMVLDDYNEDKGVSVARLAKVIGYRTVFCPNMEREGIMEIPKEEMFRFSHLVPHHGLESREAPDAPKGCVELDPAATPLELLQMGTKDDNANDADLGKRENEGD